METSRLDLLRRLSYRPGLVRLAHRLGLRRVLSELYYRLHRPADGIVGVELDGVVSHFHVHASWQLRWLESLGTGAAMDPDLQVLRSTLRPGDTLYDIGANMGVFTVLLAQVVGRDGHVVAFEPQSRVYDHLRRNLDLNHLTNVRAFRKALGDTPGQGAVYIEEKNVLSRLVPLNGTTKPHEDIDIVEGDRLRVDEGLPVPRAVKIDVEGYEYATIRGLRETLSQPGCELVCCEIHPPLLPAGVTQDAVLALLRSLGFGRVTVHPFDTWSVAICRKGSS